jgi:Sulfotransferase family
MPFPEPSDKPKVVYVMGAGHSGSTILGVTLGNCEKFFYAGELEEWLLRSGVPKFGGLERTRFWRSVGERVTEADDLFGPEVRETLERSASVLRPSTWSARRRLRKRYGRVSEDLYRAIATVAGATHIVDTSHFPLRAHELQHVDGIDLYLVFLVRNPQGVIESYLKPINRHASAERMLRVITKNVDLWLTHILAVSVFLRHRRDRRLFVRHEDFVADPQGVVRQILDQVQSGSPLPDFTSLKTGFPIQGNPLLWSDEVSVKAKPATPVRGSRITTLLQMPWTPVLSRMEPVVSSASPGPH